MIKATKSLSIILLLITTISCHGCNALEGLVKISGKVILLEVATTPEERSKGLMDRTELDDDRGMVFVFKPKQAVTFWMKNTFIPLDIIFIDNGKIVNISEKTEINQTTILYPSIFPITEVVEVNAGFVEENNVMIGDEVTFENIPDIDYSMSSELMIIK